MPKSTALTPDVTRIVTNPVDSARVVAHYLQPDPEFWLKQAVRAGLIVELIDGRLSMYAPEGFGVQTTFLDVWLNLGDGREGVKRLLAAHPAAGRPGDAS